MNLFFQWQLDPQSLDTDRLPIYTVHRLDGSTEMLERARERLARFGGRFLAWPLDLAARSWRDINEPVHAVVTSLRTTT